MHIDMYVAALGCIYTWPAWSEGSSATNYRFRLFNDPCECRYLLPRLIFDLRSQASLSRCAPAHCIGHRTNHAVDCTL